MDEISKTRDELTIDAVPGSNWVPAIKVLSGPKEGSVLEIKGDSFTIGRSSSNSLVLNDKAVSRRHAAIEQKDKRYIIHDLESRWGLKVNGHDLKEAGLNFGNEIEIAGTRMIFDLVIKDRVTKRPSRWLRHAIVVLLFAAAASSATLFYFRHQSQKDLVRPGADVLSQIIFHYDQGISYYNKMSEDKGTHEKVLEEMKKVIALDPKGTTQFSRSARRIIDGFEK
ncbi:MAG: hypothetical protein COV46_00560 [Deltaproteobacteria bacterium CG11_big_fil_rev_8_21_14_0_20_49_13]|nr:MAG: hypothetical protein COV46_00560 [Deltaproteobacteria bacterium CG11_big_fil_rev_8_21_14_0_20_49_13]